MFFQGAFIGKQKPLEKTNRKEGCVLFMPSRGTAREAMLQLRWQERWQELL